MEVIMKLVFRALALTSIICSVSEFAYAASSPLPCTACGIRGAPGPEIGDGVVGFAAAAVILFAVLMLPRIKRLVQTKIV
jgi:hypothetical protein